MSNLSMDQAVEWMTKTLLENTPHSGLGASGGDRWINCSGSYKEQQKYEDEQSVFAAEGTFAHAFSEMLRVFEVPASDYKGMKCPDAAGYTDFEVDPEMVECIQGFVDRANEFKGEAFYEVMVDYSEWADNGEE